MELPQGAPAGPKPMQLSQGNYDLWKKRWATKLADRSRPATPQPDIASDYPPFVPVQQLISAADKLAELAAEGLYQASVACPSCRTDSGVFDDVVQGRTVCRACGLILQERLISNESEVEYDQSKDKIDTTYRVQNNIDNDTVTKPWLPELQTGIEGVGSRSSGSRLLRHTHAVMESKKLDIADLLYKHSEAYDMERLRMLASRNAELTVWLEASLLKAEQVQSRVAELQQQLDESVPAVLETKRATKAPAADPARAALAETLKHWKAASQQTETVVQDKIKELGRAVKFLTTSHLEAKMTDVQKKQLHEEIAFRRFAGVANNLHHVAAVMFDSVPAKLLAKSQEYMKRFVELHDKRLNSRDTWSCCCLQIAAMHDFGYMFNERELRAQCSQPCKLKTLRKDIRLVRKVLQLPPLSPADLVQLNRTHLQRPFAGLGKCRGILYTRHPLTYEEEAKLDVLFVVVLELAYACMIPKPEPFTRRLPVVAGSSSSSDNGGGGGDEEDEEGDDDDPEEADDITNQVRQEQDRKQQSMAGGTKRGRSASGEAQATADMPASKKHQTDGRRRPTKTLPKLGLVTEDQDAQTDANAVWEFLKLAVIVLNKVQNGGLVPDPSLLRAEAAAWPDGIKNHVLAGLQRRAPRTVASALFYLGVLSMRSPSMRITCDVVRTVAYVGAIPIRDCKSQLRDLLAFVMKQRNVQDLLASALTSYVQAVNLAAGTGNNNNNNNSSSNGVVSMELSSSADKQKHKASAVAALMLCP